MIRIELTPENFEVFFIGYVLGSHALKAKNYEILETEVGLYKELLRHSRDCDCGKVVLDQTLRVLNGDTLVLQLTPVQAKLLLQYASSVSWAPGESLVNTFNVLKDLKEKIDASRIQEQRQD